MKHALAVLLTGTLIVAAGYVSTTIAQQQSQPTGTNGTASAEAVPPLAVEVVAVDPQAKTITVRDIAAVPAPNGKAVEVTLPVPANATGQKLTDTKAGQKIDVTCAVKPTVHPKTGMPVVLTDCVRVIKIEPKS
jgi:hypothetical protein